MKLDASDIRGVVGIVPTPANPDAASWAATDTVNLAETEKMVRLVTGAGIEIIMTNGTFGEAATLTWPELQDFVGCVVDSSGDAIVFAGITTLNTRDTVARGRRLLELGADGLFIGRPMWLSMHDPAIIRFYQDLAEAFPGVPMVLYDNPLAFKRPITTEVYDRLADIPELVAAKHAASAAMPEHTELVGDRLRILPPTAQWLPLARAMPDLALASWSGHVACAPSAAAAMSKAVLDRDWERAEAISEKLNWAEAPMFPGGDLAKFMDYSIQLGHARFQAAGLVDIGPTRPPYIDAPEEYLEGSMEAGRRMGQLEAEFSRQAEGQRV